LMMRYWLPPRVVDAACTEVVGELAVAVKVIVFPIGVKAGIPIILPLIVSLRQAIPLFI